MVVKDAITLILMLQAHLKLPKPPQNVEQIVVESCDEVIGKENDALKLEVKRLEQNIKVLEK
jgi:hypothetical protein